MATKIWGSGAVSIIVLPSGEQGREILDLAEAWSRSWLLTPALWMLADEIPNFESNPDVDSMVPPKLSAYLLGRDSEQNPVREQVDVFWALGSQQFKIIRFIAVRTEQDESLMNRTSLGAQTAATFVQRAVPLTSNPSKEQLSGALFSKYNLIIAPTNERRLIQGVLSPFWDANLVAAAEDRSTPMSTDSFVKIEERFIGFALAHIATTAGLWAGLPVSSAEINSEQTQLKQARLQRVFVRGVTNDALSADVAHWALQKLNNTDSNFEIGLVEGRNVTTIASELEENFMNSLVEYIMRGPETEKKGDNFLYKHYESLQSYEPKVRWFIKLKERIEDMAAGLAAIPSWIKASAEYRLDIAIDDVKDEQILYDAVPRKFAPQLKVKPIDVLMASLKPRDPLRATADLWRHLRESISASIDAPSNNHPEVLIDRKDNSLLVFSKIDRVLPDPETSWSGDSFSSGTSAKLENAGWLDASKVFETSENLRKRIEELAPGLADAKDQLSETQKLADEAEQNLKIVSEELSLIERELQSDIEAAKTVSENHSHKLPPKVTGPVKRPKGNVKNIFKRDKSHTESEFGDLKNQDIGDKSSTQKKLGFFSRVFKRKGGSK
jgi:hypothetical protein